MSFICQRRQLLLALFFLLSVGLALMSCTDNPNAFSSSGSPKDEAEKFLADAEKRLLDLNIKAGRADWVKSTFITDDTELLAAEANENLIAATTELAEQSRKYENVDLSPESKRKLKLLKLALTLPAPKDPAERSELTKITASMEGEYGKGKYCPDGDKGKCLSLPDLEDIINNSRDPEELKKAWVGWHQIAIPIRKEYVRFVELSNKGAKEMGFKDTGAMWRSKYDMEPDEFAAEMERLWQQVKPLYDSLYTYTRRKLSEKYGKDVVAEDKPIPAHLLGNMWAQQWGNIYPILAPANADRGYDLTQILKARNTDAKQMVRYGESFFTSLGFDPLPQTFWERSLFLKPADREVVCHASAWDIDFEKDVRLKMCVQINEEDFSTVHHELGHNYYQMAYSTKPFLFRDSANDGFHEAIGDTVALSVTPAYLKQLGLIDKVPDQTADMGFLLNRALDKVAFLPFGYLIDQWRWKVFSGEVGPNDYNKAWWDLRLKYQGIVPPPRRGGEYADELTKTHINDDPAQYYDYAIANALLFQMHDHIARNILKQDPHDTDYYGNRAVGDFLQQLMAPGASRPWREVLRETTGRELDARAMMDYFRPLYEWLQQQNRGRKHTL